jgi:hypothetical protein
MARTRKYYLKKLFDFEVKGQGPIKVITVRDTPPYGHEYTTYLSMLDLFELFDLEIKNIDIKSSVHGTFVKKSSSGFS